MAHFTLGQPLGSTRALKGRKGAVFEPPHWVVSPRFPVKEFQTISSIRPIDLALVDDLVEFVRGRGYVLNFSDSSFSEFFSVEFGVDIDAPIYAENGGSKGKRLRCFLTKVDDAMAALTLEALWEHRVEYLIRSGSPDPVPQAESRYKSLLTRLMKRLGPPRHPLGGAFGEHTQQAGMKGCFTDMTEISEPEVELAILKALKSLGSSDFHSDQDVLSVLAESAIGDLALETLIERTEFLADQRFLTWKPLRGDGTILAFMAKLSGDGQAFLREQARSSNIETSSSSLAHPEPLPPYDEAQEPWSTELPGVEEWEGPLPKVDVAILVAVQVELEAVLRKLLPFEGAGCVARYVDRNDFYYLGRFGVYDSIVAMCTNTGTVGPGGATLTAARLLERASPHAVLMPGVCFGRLGKKQNIGDVVVATEVICYEPERSGLQSISRAVCAPTAHHLLTMFKNALYWRFTRPDGTRCAKHFGGLLSGEKLVDNPTLVRDFFETFPKALGGEMEGAGLYGAAAEKKIDFVVVKAICDWGTGKSDDHQALAAAASVSLVHEVLTVPRLFQGHPAPPRSVPRPAGLQAEGIAAEWWQCLDTRSDPSRRKVDPYHQTWLKVTFRVRNLADRPTTLECLEHIHGDSRLRLVSTPYNLRTREADHGGGNHSGAGFMTPQSLPRLEACDAKEINAWLSGALLPLPANETQELTFVLRDVRGDEVEFRATLEADLIHA